jgi:hypothetical protein
MAHDPPRRLKLIDNARELNESRGSVQSSSQCTRTLYRASPQLSSSTFSTKAQAEQRLAPLRVSSRSDFGSVFLSSDVQHLTSHPRRLQIQQVKHISTPIPWPLLSSSLFPTDPWNVAPPPSSSSTSSPKSTDRRLLPSPSSISPFSNLSLHSSTEPLTLTTFSKGLC